MNDDLSPVQEMRLRLWRENYPFMYWANRINKINPLNPHDELEAVFTLLHLADTYRTILVAMLQNPNSPWYFVKEEAYPPNIDDTLDQFRSSSNGRVDLHNYDTDLENITSFSPNDGWEALTPTERREVRPLDLFASHLLGCPATIDSENNQLIFHEDPEKYIDLCSGVINFRENRKKFLNDLKHGFRLLPFEWDVMDELESISEGTRPDLDLDKKKEEYEETKGDYVYFWRMEGKADDEPEQLDGIPEGYAPRPVGLYVYRIELEVCRRLARTILLLLKNLIQTDNVEILDEITPLVDESGRVDTFEGFLTITRLTED